MKWIYGIALFFMSSALIGQDITFVSGFELLEVSDGVFINWQIDSGYTCQGVDILRSTDGNNFEEIGHISGVCGSLTKPVSYSFMDENPVKNVLNYYRLKLNGYGYTEILSLYVHEVPSEGMLLYPNPASVGEITIKFSNPNSREAVVQVINTNGCICWQGNTSTDVLKLDASILLKGIYKVRVLQESGVQQLQNTLVIY